MLMPHDPHPRGHRREALLEACSFDEQQVLLVECLLLLPRARIRDLAAAHAHVVYIELKATQSPLARP